MSGRSKNSLLYQTILINGLPAFGFAALYIVAVIIGSFVFFYHIEPYYSAFIFHSGVTEPQHLTPKQIETFWLVALGAPAILVLAFFLAFSVVHRHARAMNLSSFDSPSLFPISLVAFVILAIWGAWSLVRADAPMLLWSWGNYADWMEARWKLFGTLSFFEFANLYQFLPASAVMLLLVGMENRGIARFLGWIGVVVCIAFGLLLFQKKAVLVSMLIFAIALLIRRHLALDRSFARALKLASVALAALVVVFAASVLLPTYLNYRSTIGDPSNTNQQAGFIEEWQKQQTSAPSGSATGEAAVNTGGSGSSPAVGSTLLGIDGKGSDRGSASSQGEANASPLPGNLVATTNGVPGGGKTLGKGDGGASGPAGTTQSARQRAAASPWTNDPLVLTVNSFIMRSPASAAYYVAVFPEKHGYYPLDLGQDIAGVGSMPDDNIVVWHEMYPDMPGTVAAPYNFVLFSQGGTGVALAVSLVLGLLLGGLWAVVINARGAVIFRSALGAIVVVGALHLAIDALRNTVVVSYGFLWAVVPIVLLLLAGRLSGLLGGRWRGRAA